MEYRLSSTFNVNNRLVIVSYSLPSPGTNHRRLNGRLQPRFAFSGLSVEKWRRSTVVVAGASNYNGFSNGISSYCEFSGLNTPIEPATNHRRLNGCLPPRFAFSGLSVEKRRRSTVVVAGASNYSGFSNGSSSYCEFSGLNTPIEPVTPAGRFLSSVLLNERKSFHDAVTETLEKLVAEVDEAYARRTLTADTTEACLHRRIAELKEHECQTAVEDVMYMLILYRFSEIKVHLVPRLSKCIYNNRLEILPSKDWELESIHTFEILKMIREHLTSVIGWKSNFSVTDNWATTKVKRLDLSQIYKSSILFGYFLKSRLMDPIDDIIFNKLRRKDLVVGGNHDNVSMSPLSLFLTGFTRDSVLKCAQPNSKEAFNLITKHGFALFGDVESDEMISTSFATLKRFVLEAIAFGSFLWDTEEYVKTIYNLSENT